MQLALNLKKLKFLKRKLKRGRGEDNEIYVKIKKIVIGRHLIIKKYIHIIIIIKVTYGAI